MQAWRRMPGYFCLVTLILLSGSASADLATNEDFEGGFTNGVANGWTSFSSSGYSPTFSDGTEHVRNGSHAQEVLMPSGSDAYGGIWQQITVPVGKRIRITAWQYKEYNDTHWYVVSSIGVDRNGGTQWNHPHIFVGEASADNNEWTMASITVRSDTGTLTFWLRTLFKYNVGGSATIWWDEVDVVDVGPDPVPTAAPAPHDGWPRFEELPYPKDGIIAGQISSRDHTGGNADGCAYTPLNTDDGIVLIDMKGPGAITDIWQTGMNPAMQIKFNFDEETTPEIESPILEFFNGESCRWIDQGGMPWTQYQVYPYIDPLNRGFDDAGGGFVSNFIFPFEDRLKILQRNKGCYFATSFHKYKSSTEVATYDFDIYGEEVEYQRSVFDDPTVDPKSTSGNQTFQGTLNLSPGQSGVLASINDSGYIAAIKVNPSPNTRSAIQNAWLEIRFDGRAPSVFVPLGHFFGCGFDERNVNAMGIGMSSSGYYYCYFPMPFWESALIRIVNQGSAAMSIPYEVQWNSADYESHALYFTARMFGGNVIDIKGSGTYLGCLCTIDGNHNYNLSYLEGDERINVDGENWVTHLGTGTEDFFHGGWYYEVGEFSNATHGCPFIAINESGRDLHSQYRLRPIDFIPFRRSFTLNLEPVQPDVGIGFLAYSYQRPVTSMEQTDSLNVGDGGSESAHNYSISGQTWSGSFSSAFEGVNYQQQHTFSGRAFTGYCQFDVAIDSANDGVLLRRCLDHATPGQEGDVYVDGQLVGRWYTFDKNENLRWFEDGFVIPRQYTEGKSGITVKIANADPQVSWTEFYYDVFSMYHFNTNDVHLEAEDQAGTQTSGQPAYSENVSAWDYRWSNDRHLRFAATGTGQWVQWPISIPTAGRYSVNVGYTAYSNYGVGRMSIDGETLGDDINMAGSYLARREQHMGIEDLSAGSHTVRFTVVGQGGGYQLGIDCLDFNRILTDPLPTETPWIPGTPQPTNTPVPPVFRLESGTVSNVGTSWKPVSFNILDFDSPVVVCSAEYAGNSKPYVVRVRNVSASGFEVRIQNPSDQAVNAVEVHYLAVEEGVWTMPDGRKIEAQTYLSTVTDRKNSWVGQAQSYGQTYTSPVVLGQVMTAGDPDWSVFWCYGTALGNPPSSGALKTGKAVCEDTDYTRNNETIGFIVIEQGKGVLDGVPYEAYVGSDIVQGVGNSPPYNYSLQQSYGSTPAVGIVTMAGLDGGDGGWSMLYGANPLSTTQISLVVDEDQVGDSERAHTTEQLGYMVFQSSLTIGGLTATSTPTPTNTPTPTPSSGGLLNGDMEGGFTSGVANYWTSYCTNGNPTFSDGTDQYHGGAHSQKIVYPQPSGGGYAGIYQVVNCSSGQNGTLTAWKYDITGGGPWDIVCRLGYDLTGGTNPQGGNVVWTEFDCTPHETWLSRQVQFTTTGSNVTVFIEAWHKGWGGTHTAWLDDVTLDGVGGPVPTPTVTPTPGGPTSTPACPGESLESLTNMSFQVSWSYEPKPNDPPGWEVLDWTAGGPQYYTGGELSNGRPSDHRCKYELEGGATGTNHVIAKEIEWGSVTSVDVSTYCAGRKWDGSSNGTMSIGVDLDGCATTWSDADQVQHRTSNNEVWAQISLNGLSKPQGATTFTLMLRANRSGSNWNCQFDEVSATESGSAQAPSPFPWRFSWNEVDALHRLVDAGTSGFLVSGVD